MFRPSSSIIKDIQAIMNKSVQWHNTAHINSIMCSAHYIVLAV
jgi:hypothetical protein